jgi:hypothetical protein
MIPGEQYLGWFTSTFQRQRKQHSQCHYPPGYSYLHGTLRLLPRGSGTSGRGRRWERVWEGDYGAHAHMYINEKMRPVETIPGMWVGRR